MDKQETPKEMPSKKTERRSDRPSELPSLRERFLTHRQLGQQPIATRVFEALSLVAGHCKRVASFLRQWSASIKIPGCGMRFPDIASFAIQDVRESKVSFGANVVAILVGTILTASLFSLLLGINLSIEKLYTRIAGINSVVAWVDYNTGEEPITQEEFETFERWPEVVMVAPEIKQMLILYEKKMRETIAVVVSSLPDDPETQRYELVAGSRHLDPNGWDILLTESVAAEINNINPLSLVGRMITLEVRRYKQDTESGEATPSKILKYPVRVVGILAFSESERVYGSLNMLRALRDFCVMRSDYTPEPGGTVDLAQVSKRTMYEGVRMHFPNPRKAESGVSTLTERFGRRFDFYWAGQQMQYLRDVQLVAVLVLLGIGSLTIFAGSISVFNTLRASVARKASDIGVLRALGATRVDLFIAYMLQSLLVGVAAGFFGLAGPWLLNKHLNNWVVDRWDLDVEIFHPLFFLPGYMMLSIFGIVLLICLVAALEPSWRATKVTPMEIIRRASGQ